MGLSFLAACFSYAGLFYIHEFGHVIFGVTGNLFMHMKIGQFQFTNWVNWPFPFPGLNPVLFSIIVPVQTGISPNPGAWWTAFGGIITVSCLTIIAGYFFYRILRGIEKTIVIFLMSIIIIYQIFSNYFCGTDHLTQSYYLSSGVCNPIDTIFQIVIPLSFFIFYFTCFSNRLLFNKKSVNVKW